MKEDQIKDFIILLRYEFLNNGLCTKAFWWLQYCLEVRSIIWLCVGSTVYEIKHYW